MATITTSLSSRVDARGKSEILLRFVGGRGIVLRGKSGIYIRPERWKDGAVVIPRLAGEEQLELKETRAELERLTAFLLDEFAAADRSVVSREWLADAVARFHHPERGGGGDFFQLWDEFARMRDVSEARLKRFRVTREALRRFETVRGRRLTVAGTTPGTLEEFREFLTREHEIAGSPEWRALYRDMDRKMIPGERSKNTVIEYLAVLRTFFHWLRSRKVTDADPFARFKIGSCVYGTPYYLTIGERDAIRDADLSGDPRLAVQRDVFIFQCLVGCRVGDLVRLRKGDVVDGVLSYIPRKTKDGHPVTVRVPLTETAAGIVARYSGMPGDRLLPFMSPQKYDAALKEIFAAAGVTRIVTVLDPLTRTQVKRPLNEIASSHLARRTFIGNLYRQVKDPSLIGSMTGHVEGSRAFARYRSIDDEIKADVVRLLDEKPPK